MFTLREILTRSTEYLKKNGIEGARLDGELLVAHVLGLSRLKLYLQLERPLEETELAAARRLLWQRAKKRLPVADLLGKKEFYGLDFFVDESVLIPRPETELLVERVLEFAPGAQTALEVGVGSGAIAVSLAKALPKLQVWATDLSEQALAVAQKNCLLHQVTGQVHLYKGSLGAPLEELAGSFEVVVSNPPYIPKGELAALAPELKCEPQLALDGGADGLAVIRPLVRQAFSFLSPGGLLALEIGSGQGQAVTGIAQEAGFADSQCQSDYARLERLFFAWRPGK